MAVENSGYAARIGRHGSRWYGPEPTGEDVAEWFATVPLHEGMRHEDYVAGISLIQTIESVKRVVAMRGDGTPQLAEVEEVTWTPYPKVDSRIAYFWAYVALHPEWEGSIHPVDVYGAPHGLPPGFFQLIVKDGAGKEITLVGRSMSVRINSLRDKMAINHYPAETKTVPMVNKGGFVDADAMAKASTGAIGRALGVAGMLVLPGSGVATAEDMREVQSATGPRLPAQSLSAPPIAPPSTRAELSDMMEKLANTDKREDIMEWWSMRHFPEIAKLDDEQIAVAVFKCRQMLDA